MHYLGIEIGGTKLQLGIGPGDGTLAGIWRETVNVAEGPEGIRRQITQAVPDLLAKAQWDRSQLKGVGIGFGGPVDDGTRSIIKSHQIEGWDNFPLADWISGVVGLPAVLGNDADVAGLAEALFGAARELTPVFYITLGSGIGGGLILNGEIHRGAAKGAAEIGHLRIAVETEQGLFHGPLENIASGWAIQKHYLTGKVDNENPGILMIQIGPGKITVPDIARLAGLGDKQALSGFRLAWTALAEAICHVIALVCPRRIVIGGGVSLLGNKFLFEPLRQLVAERVFLPFAGLTDIVPAALGEEVVVHGALALARQKFKS